jgi:hypothetical protein
MNHSSIAAFTACLLFGVRTASAQQIIQQPVVEQFSADTVVSVPDRGSLYLGGVGSASASRREYGPIPWGTASGRFTSSSDLDVSVYIHDFESMDAALLSEPTRDRDRPTFRSPRAASAWRDLKKNWRRE